MSKTSFDMPDDEERVVSRDVISGEREMHVLFDVRGPPGRTLYNSFVLCRSKIVLPVCFSTSSIREGNQANSEVTGEDRISGTRNMEQEGSTSASPQPKKRQ